MPAMSAVVLLAASLAGQASPATGPEADLLRRLLGQARVALRAGDTKRASVLAESALRAVRRRRGTPLAASVPLHREAQDILSACGRGDELVRLYDGILRRNLSDPDARYLRARVEPDPRRKLLDLSAVLASSKEHFWAAYDLAGAYAERGEWSAAARSATKAAGLRPREAAAWNVLGHLRLEASRFLDDASRRKDLAERAREALAKALEIDPSLAEAHYNMGLASYALGETDAARKSWKEATRLRPDFAEAWNSLGHVEARAGRVKESIALYKKALESPGAARPSRGIAHNNLAVAYYRLYAAGHAKHPEHDEADLARSRKHLALAEAARHEPAQSFKRVLVRAVEEREFVAFMKAFTDARSRRLTISFKQPASNGPAIGSALLGRAVLKMRFRDSRGGVGLGERKVGATVVARYLEAARVEIVFNSGPPAAGKVSRELIVVAREAADGSDRRLAGWVAESGYRFSAEAPELVKLVARLNDSYRQDAKDASSK